MSYAAGQRPLAPAPAPSTNSSHQPLNKVSPSSQDSHDSSLNAAAHALVGASRNGSSTQLSGKSTDSDTKPVTANFASKKAKTSANNSGSSTPTTNPKPPKKPRRSKVAEACKFCRRSHMSCDAGRPCSRCVKRDIAHLCKDEPLSTTASGTTSPVSRQSPAPPSHTPSALQPQPQLIPPSRIPPPASLSPGNNMLGLVSSPSYSSALQTSMAPVASGAIVPSSSAPMGMQQIMTFASHDGSGSFNPSVSASQMPMLSNNFNLAMLDLASGQDGLGAGLGLDMTMEPSGEFHGLELSEFLQSLNESPYDLGPSPPMMHVPQHQQQQQQEQIQSRDNRVPEPNQQAFANLPTNAEVGLSGTGTTGQQQRDQQQSAKDSGVQSREGPSVPGSPVNKTERFLLTAADQKDGSRSDRLARVIHAKFEAGLLRPYNHVAGYTRLMKWMADNMSTSSKQRTLRTLSEFRPAFRAIASGLTDLDLVFIEEAFERLLLDYDRVFSSMGIPSCLWRRTGEIYKGNKEFAALVGVPIEHLQGGKLAIYELMAEESAVNYWEKYGNIAFDAGQKAVLTSCVLVNQSVLSKKRKKPGQDKQKRLESAMINCCFSFTIRRDSYAIPSLISGNWIPC